MTSRADLLGRADGFGERIGGLDGNVDWRSSSSESLAMTEDDVHRITDISGRRCSARR